MMLRPGWLSRLTRTRARRPRNERGATLAEYAMALGATVLVVVAGINQLEDDITSELDDRGNSIGEPDGDSYTSPTVTTTPPATTTPAPTTTGTVGTIHISSIASATSWSSGKWVATVEIAVRDGSNNLVAGATVEGDWALPFHNDTTCTTDSTGKCSMTQWNINATRSSTTWTVLSVAAPGFTYDSGANVVSNITINRP